jgi:hypothetical protein
MAPEIDPVLLCYGISTIGVVFVAALVAWGLRGRRSEYERGLREGRTLGYIDGYNNLARVWRDMQKRYQ